MNLDEKAMHVIVTCISRSEHLTLETDPATQTGLWCKECRTYSGVVLPVRGISTQGVYDLGTVTACALCDGGSE